MIRRLLTILVLSSLSVAPPDVAPSSDSGNDQDSAALAAPPGPPSRRPDGASSDIAPVHRDMLVRLAAGIVAKSARVACCWADLPDSQPTIDAFNAALTSNSSDFQLNTRWTTTAFSGSVPAQGTPTVLSYGFVADGTIVPSGVGEPVGPSNLIATLNAAFGTQALWQGLLTTALTNWGNFIGVTYIHEANDDGLPMFSGAGAAGIRPDIRICGKTIDGALGILAYNFFPNDGDMCFDTADAAFFANTVNNYRTFRNTVGHEHGHGLGLFHVCPTSATKLMEPLLATAFDGPQLDDVLGGQRHYGDRLESNDSPASATNLGALPDGTTTVANVSTDDDTDVDVYAVSIAAAKDLTVTVRPFGQPYVQASQSGACTTGTTFNPTVVSNLGFSVIASDQTTVIAGSNNAAIGVNETLGGIPLASAGTYYVRVFPDGTNGIQAYELDLTLGNPVPPAFTIDFPNGLPTTADPNMPTHVTVRFTNVAGAVDGATAFVHVAVGGQSTPAIPLVSLGGADWDAVLPASPCFTRLTWYVSAASMTPGPTIVAPFGAPSSRFTTDVQTTPLIVAFVDDFEVHRGWSVVDNAALTAGTWERAVPNGGGARGDPPADADGSGRCYVTLNGVGNTDVDDGATVLTSPAFDLSPYPAARIGFRLWFDNVFGANPATDPFVIEISNDNGATWVLLESWNASLGTWVLRQYVVADYVPHSAGVRVRFTAQDPIPGAVVEAGIDAFILEACSPAGPALGAGGSGNVGGVLGPFDVLTVNGSAGGASRRVDVAALQPITLAVSQPPTTVVPAPFTLWGYFNVPAPTQSVVLPFNVGIMSFNPCALAPLAGTSFTICDGFGFDPCPRLLTATPAPWTVTIAGIGGPFTVTIQGVILGDAFIRVTNGVILRIL